ncbi:hypothetical protein FGB62_36g122 [Gracilaria domingensis]|nr:hypothetical protein FGB62_36g122 [Gracilaria domingensis]
MDILENGFFPSTEYNLLPHIDELSEYVVQKSKALRNLLSLIETSGLQSVFSVHLVHKHFDVSPGHIMVYETVKLTNAVEVQICRPRLPEKVADINGVYYKAHKNGKMASYEFTTDAVVDISPYEKFVEAFHAALVRLEVVDIFALTVRRLADVPQLYEFEVPQYRSTVLVSDRNWFRNAVSSQITDWGARSLQAESCDYIIKVGCIVTRSGKHHGQYCLRTRSGKHYRRPSRKNHSSEAHETKKEEGLEEDQLFVGGNKSFASGYESVLAYLETIHKS